uniref:Zinc finger HIT domain-containing protein 3 n=1 Tax=Scapholeberis mucronata TaxID=202097 RepID=A0A4Y7NLD8_9CRUS|nr:EOG090X0JQ4 [Scapholeberis mucronata]SVE94012.1 EOG090X0JQ4 [Scapholeberis mucronata]
MTVVCQLCNKEPFKYKCPTCYIKYCSLQCFKVHKESPCEKPNPEPSSSEIALKECPPLSYQFPTADTVPIHKLQELGQSEEVKQCLSNPHVRDILRSMVHSSTPDTAISNMMKEPIFLELAHACLKVVEPEKFQPEFVDATGSDLD